MQKKKLWMVPLVLALCLLSGPGRADAPPPPEEFIENNYFLGRADAPVVIVEFSDFQCFYCQKFTRQTLPRIRKRYIDTGRVRFVFSDFPLDFHAQAMAASHAARCAGRQERFWEYHDRLFASKLKAFGPNLFARLARETGLDRKRFERCSKDEDVRREVVANFKRGLRIGIRGTPAFLVLSPEGGKIMSGAYPFEVFAKVIDAELDAAKAREDKSRSPNGQQTKDAPARSQPIKS